MKNCTICSREFKGAKKSAANENGDFYLICNGCGQVYLVTHDDLGLSIIEKTKTGKDAYDQMMEAKKLFESAGVGIYGFKDDIHSEKKSSLELEELEAKEEPKDSAPDFFNDILGPIMSSIFEKRRAEVEAGLEKDNTEAEAEKAGIEAFIDGVSQAIELAFGKEKKENEESEEDTCDDCGCNDCSKQDYCSNGCSSCDEDENESCDKKEDKDKIVLENSIKDTAFIVEAIQGGKRCLIRCSDDKELFDCLHSIDGSSDCEIISVKELKEVTIRKTVKYQI